VQYIGISNVETVVIH